MAQSLQKNEQSKDHQFRFTKLQIVFHLLVVIFHLFYITKIQVSYADSHPQQTQTQSYVSTIINRKRDSHDTQWETYRNNLPIMIIAMLCWHALSRKIENKRNEKSWLLGGLILLYSLKSDLIIYLAILISWFYFTTKCYNKRYFVPLCWFITILTLYLNQISNHFQSLSQNLSDFLNLDFLKIQNRQISFSQFLNITFLKLLSFSLDKKKGDQQRQLQKHVQKCQQCQQKDYCIKGRNFIATQDYSFSSFMNYILFAPTLFTGPPISYKNFASFWVYPSNKKPQIFKLILNIIFFEIFQHYAPVIQLNQQQSFVEAQIIILFHLVFIWFKFLIIWRVGKVWAQICGIQVIDNLSRCVCNNYGFQGFWRMWHRGFNQWLIRYLYIPLGGNKNIFSIVGTVLFVAFWHDHSFNILIWALGIIIFILPEILIKRYARTHLKHLFKEHWFKYLSAFTSAIYIYFLVFANIIGFGYGQHKLNILLQKIMEEWLSVVWSIAVLTSAVLMMFYQRSLQGNEKNY